MSEPTSPDRESIPTENSEGRRGIIHNIVQAPLSQPLLVLLLVAALIGLGLFSLYRLPVDAYPDVSPSRVEVATPWPGRAAE